MLRAWWFNEWSPKEQVLFEQIIQLVKKNYASFWYSPLETPAVERNTVLLAKSWQDASKQIFGLYGLAQWWEDLKDYSLRFDLTVPTARYVLDWRDQLAFPFKRYQVQPVWRGERQQRWRYKQFYQADVDVIWDDKDGVEYPYYDAEVICVAYTGVSKVLELLKVDDIAVIQINNRKLILWLLQEFFPSDEQNQYLAINLVDKLDKLTAEEFEKQVKEIMKDPASFEEFYDILMGKWNVSNLSVLASFFPENELLQKGIAELTQTITYIEYFKQALWNVEYKVNISIVRWLDYYTGVVFETKLQKDPSLWSIMSWWRYQELTKYLDSKTYFGWVGASIWIDRLMIYAENSTILDQMQTTEYMFVNFEETRPAIFALYARFQKEWKIVELYPTEDKLKKQFAYADKKSIPYVVILGWDELKNNQYIIKDLKSGEQRTYSIG